MGVEETKKKRSREKCELGESSCQRAARACDESREGSRHVEGAGDEHRSRVKPPHRGRDAVDAKRQIAFSFRRPCLDGNGRRARAKCTLDFLLPEIRSRCTGEVR